jgi:hypothetical protein
MGFVEDWIESDPDGALITGSQLDDWIRQTKRALRERLEGDVTDPMSGIFEIGEFDNSARIRAGTARAYYGTDAAILALGAAHKFNGRLGISDTGKLYHIGATIAEVSYPSKSTGTTASTASGTAVTIFAVDLAVEGAYLISSWSVGVAGGFSLNMVNIVAGAAAATNIYTPLVSSPVASISGANVRLTQSSGSAQVMKWGATRMA